MKESNRFIAWMGAFALLVAVLSVLPNEFLSFMFGIVGGGMIAINAGEQLRKDRDRKRVAT